MDDMDKQSEELGGKAKFFTGEYEKYAWSKIFNSRIILVRKIRKNYKKLALYSLTL